MKDISDTEDLFGKAVKRKALLVEYCGASNEKAEACAAVEDAPIPQEHLEIFNSIQ